jgi:hypothetical protein
LVDFLSPEQGAAVDEAAVIASAGLTMGEMANLGLQAAGFLINIIVLSIGGVWALSKAKDAIREDAEKRQAALREEGDKRHMAIMSLFESDRRTFAETLLALRQKINDVELGTAKEFKEYVRRESWHQAMNQLQVRLDKADQASDERALRLEAKMDDRLDAMSGKIDRLFERMGGGS